MQNQKPKIYKQWERPLHKRYDKKGISRTKQSFKEECDINNILKKFKRAGLNPFMDQFGNSEIDLYDSLDFQTAQNVIADSKSKFEMLPAELRKELNNNPDEFLKLMTQKDRAIEVLKRHGLVKIIVPKETESGQSAALNTSNTQNLGGS